jgi:3-oxoacyl-[acyl-carrier-protein] synthase II
VKPIVVTGVGIASAFGVGGLETLRGSPPNGRHTEILAFDAKPYGAALPVVEVPAFDPTQVLGGKGLRTLDRLTKLLLVAARLALRDAGLKSDGQWTALSPTEVGVCTSNAYGSLEAIAELDRVAVLEDARYINPAKFPNTVSNSASGYIGIWEDLRALNVTVSDGNCGALDAVACADLMLATKRARAILTGGGEPISEALYLAFEKLRAFSTPTSASPRPGSGNFRLRGSFGGSARLGEGAAFVVVEEPAAAAARGARSLGAITSYGTAFVGPEDDRALAFASSSALQRAIQDAIRDAGRIDVVASGICGLPGFAKFDEAEQAAIASVLGDVPIALPKQHFGEALGADGALAMAAALAWLDGAPLPPLLDRQSAPKSIERVLVTSLGYYGNASALVIEKHLE